MVGVHVEGQLVRSEVGVAAAEAADDRPRLGVEQAGADVDRLVVVGELCGLPVSLHLVSLARQEYPDTTAYDDAEIVYRVKKKHHAGLIVRSPKLECVNALLNDYGRRFAEDFVAVLPPMERPE